MQREKLLTREAKFSNELKTFTERGTRKASMTSVGAGPGSIRKRYTPRKEEYDIGDT